MAANMADLLQLMVDRRASDLHLTSGTYPQLRIDGSLVQLTQFEQLTPQDTQRLAYSVLNETQKQKFEEENELDLSFGIQRSEEHTSELQSRLHLVCRLLLEKK